MKNALILAGLLLISSLAVFGQGYDRPPSDAKTYPIGIAGTPYESMELGEQGGALHVACLEDPAGWNDTLAYGTSSMRFTNLMHRGLVNYDQVSSALAPDLCTSWEISEDGLAIVFYLRQGILWSDGEEEITARDVRFTYDDVILNDDIDSRWRDALQLPDGNYPELEVIDRYTIRMKLSVVFRPVLDALRFNVLPEHALARSVDEGTFDEAWGLDTPRDELVGNGPYIVTDYQVNVSVTMERNPYYYGYDNAGTQLPYFDKFVSHIVTNQDVSMLKFRNGEIDVYGMRPEDIPILLPERAGKGYSVMITDLATYGTTWIMVNQDVGLADGTDAEKRELYRNVKFREALAHLLDKDTMIHSVLNGLGMPLWSPVSVPSPFYAGRDYYGGPITENDSVCFEYNPALAASKLDALGAVDADGDGWRDLPSGEPFSIEINANDNTMRVAYCLIIQDDFRAAGLHTNFQVIDFNTLVDRLFSSTGDIVLLGLTGGDEPNSGKNVYASCGSLHAYRYSACEEPDEVDLRIDELINLGAGTFDLDEAFEYYKEYQQLLAYQLGYIYLVRATFQYAYYDHVGNAHMASPISTPDGDSGLLTELCFDERL